MKKILILEAAALIGIACTKSIDNDSKKEIKFQAASFASTKANTDYKTDYAAVPFGTYAWYKGVTAADNTGFMTNQKVSYVAADNIWKPEGITYYWPKNGSLDFISYSPYTADGSAAPLPTIAEDKITYSNWNVNANKQVDLMYADKVTGINNNADTYYYSGVPTLFHHALSRITFNFRLAYNEITAPTGDKTKWEVTIGSITLKDIRTTGSLVLDLNADKKTWTPTPAKIWDATADKTDITLDISNLQTFTTTAPQQVDEPFLVLPQSLAEGQKVALTITITTYRDTGAGYVQVLKETNIPVEGVLSNGGIDKWGINQNIIYTFILAPSLPTDSGVDTDGDGIDEVIPTEIHFDPAVEDWENVTVSAGIRL